MIHLVLISLISVFVLAGCEIKTDTFQERIITEQEQKEKNIKVSGFIKSDILSLSSKNTHLLVDKNDFLVYKIFSKTVLLDNYLTKEVEISGKLDENLFEVLSLEEESTAIEVEPEITWHDFINQEYSYVFTYPNLWQVVLAGKVIYLQDKGETVVKITRLRNSAKKSLEFFASGEGSYITLNTQKVFKELAEEEVNFFLNSEEEVIKITTKKDLENREFYNQFLQSFFIKEGLSNLQKCGGKDKLLCPQGFRCELKRGINGVCIDISKTHNLYLEKSSVSLKQVEEKAQDVNSEYFEKKETKLELLDKINVLDGDPYTNSHMNYNLIYPKHWWYKSFGAKNNSLWHTEFSKKEIENLGEGSIIVEIKEGVQESIEEELTSSEYYLYLPRNQESHFVLFGDLENQDSIKSIAKSIVIN